MAVIHCAGCGSADVQAGFNRVHCFICDRETDLNGNLLPARPIGEHVPGFRGGSQQGVRKED